MAAKELEKLTDKEIAALLIEIAEEGKVYAAVCSPSKETDFLVYLPSVLGAYWLIRGTPVSAKYPKCKKGDPTWKQVDKNLAPQIVPDLTVTPRIKPDNLSVFRWLENVPMVWFADAGRYSSA